MSTREQAINGLAGEHASVQAREETRRLRRQFVRRHRTAVYGYPRANDGPSLTVVYYVMDGEDEILVSTMRARAKAVMSARSPKVSLCVLDELWPPGYLQLYCTAALDTSFEHAVEVLMGISALMAGRAMPAAARPDVEAIVRREERVVLRLSPYATFQTPPRHVSAPDDLKQLTHWTSDSLPW